MKAVLVLSILLCAAFAAPTEDKEKQAPEAAAEALKEQLVAAGGRCSCPVWNHEVTLTSSSRNFYTEEHCNSLGAHLASYTNGREYRFLQQITRTAGQSIAWLGGFSLQGRWMWIDREGFYYTNWYSPSSSSSYPCIHLRTNCKSTYLVWMASYMS
ncbi:ladderlectin-like [Sebastes fasciatus]|uniref:ladderlectin-like n=1 Tax=Sebastes fasciatus TaxID=394691 RepID=UPI003D9E4FF0